MKEKSRGRTLRSYRELGGIEVVEIAPGETVEETVRRYRASGLVEFAEPNYMWHAAKVPNDPHFSNGLQWSLRNSSSGRDIHAVEGWDTGTSASNIVVAVLDTGIRYTHEDLAANMWVNPGEIAGNGLDDDDNGFVDDVHGMNAIWKNGDPMDDAGHGTHVAGIIGAVGNNGKGISGVAWNVKLMACKFLDANGDGSTDDVLDTIDYARRMGAHVINGSFGGPWHSDALYTAIQNLRSEGIIFVAAAGNETTNLDQKPSYPAAFPLDNIVVVGGTTRSDTLDLGYSNYGATTVDLCAPGSGIYSTWASSDVSYFSEGGTSMATPHVTGAIALMKARFTNMTHVQLIARLLETVDPLPSLAGKCRSGGRLNLAKALGPDPAANFSASAWSGEPPLQVSFTNLSLGEVRSMRWEFGDGSPAVTNMNPAHTFVRPGRFPVKLTVVGTNSKTNSIEQSVNVVSNYRFSSEPYLWVETAGMTRITLGDNEVSGPIDLPFPFRFYSVEKNEIFVSANGVVGFSSPGLAASQNIPMPNASAPNDMIAPYWDNLDPSAAGAVFYGTVGAAPNRRFVVSWVNVPRVGSTVHLTFQAILEESTGDIVFQYKDAGGSGGSGRGATVGLENTTGDIGATYLHNGAPALVSARSALRVARAAFRYLVLDRNRLWLEAPAGATADSRAIVALENTGTLNLDWKISGGSPWLMVTNDWGALRGGQTTEVAVSLDPSTAALAPGSYETSLTFSNVTDGSGNITIPVVIRLSPPPAGVLEFTPAVSNLFAGGMGGPFAPESMTVELHNTGDAALDWNSISDRGWLDVTPASGSLAAGESTSVALGLTPIAGTLRAGEYAGTVQFVNGSVAGAAPWTQSVRVQVNAALEASGATLDNGRFHGTILAPAPGNYAVEFSSDLQTWETLTSVSAVNGSVSFEDSVEVAGHRFYRLRLE